MCNLTDAEKSKIKDEERFRYDLRMGVEHTTPPKSWHGKVFLVIHKLLNNQGFQWLVAALLIPTISYMYTEQTQETERIAIKAKEDTEKAAIKAKEDTERLEKYAELVIKLLPDLAEPLTTSKYQNAFSILKALEDTKKMPTSFSHLFQQVIVKASTDVSEKANYQPSTPPQSTEEEVKDEKADSLVPPSNSFPLPITTVFTQIFDDSQQAKARQLGDVLRSMSLISPTIENVTATAKRKKRPVPIGYNAPVIIAFKESDLKTAEAIKVEVKKTLGINLTIRDRSKNTAFTKVPAGQLEIWFEDPSVIKLL